MRRTPELKKQHNNRVKKHPERDRDTSKRDASLGNPIESCSSALCNGVQVCVTEQQLYSIGH